MNHNQKATVIIPCFNVEAYIKECLDSVLLQGDSVLETFVVDNNSTDNTMGVIQEWQDAHPSFPLIICQEKKPGAPAARNNPLHLVKTKWIQFLDADDLLMEGKIKEQVEQFLEADVICAGALHLALDGSKKSSFPEESVPLALIKSQAGNTCSNLFSTSHLCQINGWDESLKSSQEYDLMFRLWKAGAKFAVDSTPRALIRERASGQISQRNPTKKWVQYIELRAEMLGYFGEGLNNKEDQDIIFQELFVAVRALAKSDVNEANRYFIKHFKPIDFKPRLGTSNSWSYIFIFSILGFRMAEKIKQFLYALKHRLFLFKN